MRIVLPVLAAALFAAPAMAVKPTPEAPDALAGAPIVAEENTYRFGYPYRSERGTTVDACALACNRDASCAAWSLTPATFKIGPRCELKRAPGAASYRPGAVSGISEEWQMDPERHGDMRYSAPVPESRQPAAVPVDQLRPSPVPRQFGDPLPKTEEELLGAPQTRISAVMQPAPAAPQAPELAASPPAQTANVAAPAQPVAPTVNAVLKRPVTAPARAAQAPAPAPAVQPARAPWTERTNASPEYSVGESDYIPGDEQATGGFAPVPTEPNS